MGRKNQWLVQLILSAADLGKARPRSVHVGFNHIYRVDAPSLRVTLRIPRYSSRTRKQTEAELALLHLLRREPFLAERLQCPVRAVALPDANQAAALFMWIPGTALRMRLLSDAQWSDSASFMQAMFQCGVIAASLHRRAHALQKRKTSQQWLSEIPLATIWGPFPARIAKACREVGLSRSDTQAIARGQAHVAREFRKAMNNAEALHLVHGDFHLGNCLHHRRNVTLIDFDDMVRGIPALDIAALSYSLRQQGASDAAMQAVQQGYETVSPWLWSHPKAKRTLEALILARQFYFANTLAAEQALPGSVQHVLLRARLLDLAVANKRYVGSSRVDLQACKLEYSIVSPK